MPVLPTITTSLPAPVGFDGEIPWLDGTSSAAEGVGAVTTDTSSSSAGSGDEHRSITSVPTVDGPCVVGAELMDAVAPDGVLAGTGVMGWGTAVFGTGAAATAAAAVLGDDCLDLFAALLFFFAARVLFRLLFFARAMCAGIAVVVRCDLPARGV